MGVTVDTTATAGMLERIAQRAEANLAPALERAARGAPVTGIPVDTGKLAASPRVRIEGDEALIVSDVPYARFVFRGTRHMPARPPHINTSALARAAADEVAREVFG